MNRTEHNKRAMIIALEKSLGVVQDACKSINVGRTTYYEWLKSDEEFRQGILEIKEVSLDFVESKLFELINGIRKESSRGKIYNTPPSVTAIIFYLKTQGKKRGYIEGYIPPPQSVNPYDSLTDEELKAEYNRLSLKKAMYHKNDESIDEG